MDELENQNIVLNESVKENESPIPLPPSSGSPSGAGR